MACPVCFTDADPALTESLNAGIFVLLGVTAVVLAGFARFVVSLVRRADHVGPAEAGHYLRERSARLQAGQPSPASSDR